MNWVGDVFDKIKEVNEHVPSVFKALFPSSVIANIFSHWFSYNNITEGISWVVSIVSGVALAYYAYQNGRKVRIENEAKIRRNIFLAKEDELKTKEIEKKLEEFQEEMDKDQDGDNSK